MNTHKNAKWSWACIAWHLYYGIAENLQPILRWLLAGAVLVISVTYLAFKPQDFTPLVNVMFSVFLFMLAYWIGFKKEVHRATQQANDRWLPQAESVIFRLMTLHANVRRFSFEMRKTCSNTESELPELKNDEMRAVRIKIVTNCEASGQRLDDVAHQLEDAIEDWRRFIAANCYGDECKRIFEALIQREEKLEKEINPDSIGYGCFGGETNPN